MADCQRRGVYSRHPWCWPQTLHSVHRQTNQTYPCTTFAMLAELASHPALANTFQYSAMHTPEIVLNSKQFALLLRILNRGSISMLLSHDVKQLLKETDLKTRRYIEKINSDWMTPHKMLKDYLHFLRTLSHVKAAGVSLLLKDYTPTLETAKLVCETFNEIMDQAGIDPVPDEVFKRYLKTID